MASPSSRRAATLATRAKVWYPQHSVTPYVFASVTDGEATLMGWMGKEEFWSEAVEVKEGELDERGKAERADAGKLKYSKLRPMERLWPLLGGGHGE